MKFDFDMEVIRVVFMIVMLCVAFYFIGYGYAYKGAAEFANEAIQENSKYCLGELYGEVNYSLDLTNINITFDGDLNG